MFGRILIILPAVLLMRLMATPCAGSVTPEAYLSAGQRAIHNKHNVAAQEFLQQVLAQYPESELAGEAGLQLGGIAGRRNDLEAERRLFEWVIANKPNTPAALMSLYYLGNRYKDKQPEKWESYCAEIVNQPADTDEMRSAKLRIANGWIDSRVYDKALQLIRSIREDKNTNVAALALATVREGQILVDRGERSLDFEEIKRGVETLREVQEKYPQITREYARSRLFIAYYYTSVASRKATDKRYRFNPNLARRILSEAFTRVPASNEYYHWWIRSAVVETYISENRHQDAADECKAVLAMNPNEEWTTYVMYLEGGALYCVHKRGEADAVLKELIAKYPDNNWAKLAPRRMGSR